jgi:Protein of unknown function (DUF3467)
VVARSDLVIAPARDGMENEDQQEIHMRVPEQVALGQYANLVGVWHTPHEFAIDFALVQPFLPDGPAATVVSRVRIPPTIVFELLKSLNQNLAAYEETFGEIQRPKTDEPDGPIKGEGGDSDD